MPTSTWTPAVTLDLTTASASAFEATQVAFKAWDDANSRPPLGLSNGWYDISPPLSESLLRHNHRNRRVSFKTVQKYAAAMVAGAWERTGQPILINQEGGVEDCQHRAWAGYLSGVDFPSYVVADVPVKPDLFAYIDDGRVRSPSDALYTAGNNGMAQIIAGAIKKFAIKYDNNALNTYKNISLGRELTVMDQLEYSRQHPDLTEATHLVMASYRSAANVIGSRPMAAFFAWKVIAAYDEETLADFFNPLGTGANLDPDDYILALRKRLIQEKKDLRPEHKLALMIRAFQARIAGEKLGPRQRLGVKDSDDFPRIEPQLPKAA